MHLVYLKDLIQESLANITGNTKVLIDSCVFSDGVDTSDVDTGLRGISGGLAIATYGKPLTEFLYHRTIVSPIGSTAQHKTVISNAVVLLPKLAYRTIVVYIIIDGIFLMN